LTSTSLLLGLKKGKDQSARRSRFRKRENTATVVCAPNEREFTKTVGYFITKADTVLELGCKRGQVTRALLGAAGSVVGVDICRKDDEAIDKNIEGADNVANLECLRTGIAGWQSELQKRGLDGFTVVYVDLTVATGNDLLFDGIALVQQLIQTFRSTLRTVVVKSKRLNAHACSFRNAEPARMLKDPWASDKVRTHDCAQLAHACTARLRVARYPNPPTRHSLKPARPPAATPQRDQSRLKVMCAVGVNQYRSTTSMLRAGDQVLEIGCHFGITTKLLHDHVSATGGRALGVDIGKQALVESRRRYPDCEFEEGSAWDTARLMALCPGLNAIYIDIGGVSGYDGLLEGVALIEQLVCAYRPTLHLLVIKSRAMRDHANTYQCSEEFMYELSTGATKPPPGEAGE
jgi:hypothetical protein